MSPNLRLMVHVPTPQPYTAHLVYVDLDLAEERWDAARAAAERAENLLHTHRTLAAAVEGSDDRDRHVKQLVCAIMHAMHYHAPDAVSLEVILTSVLCYHDADGAVDDSQRFVAP